MAENRASGPQLGQMVIFTQTQTIFYPAIIVSIDRVTGLVRLTTFPAVSRFAGRQPLTRRQPFRPHRYADQYKERSATHELHPGAGRESRRHVENVDPTKHQGGQDQCGSG
jgi:hypothetical protein